MGKTILFVSHDLGSISKYCDRVVLLNRGEKLDEGQPKPMVDLYKKLLVHQEEEAREEALDAGGQTVAAQGADVQPEGGFWKDALVTNPQVLEYGEKRAEVIDFALLDDSGKITNTVEKGTEFTIKMKVAFHETVEDPIFAYTLKDLKGTEITGTNTMFEKVSIDTQHEGDVREASFTQKMDLQGGEYLISFGCTGYRDGEFHVYHRLYDACNITVVSVKNTVGFYDMNSGSICKIEGQYAGDNWKHYVGL